MKSGSKFHNGYINRCFLDFNILGASMLKKEPGVYKIVNLITKDTYIGSTINIYNRYYSHWFLLKKLNHDNYKIREHSKLYGRESFIFEVIEYCDRNIMLEREQYYFDLIKPSYNAWNNVYNAKGRSYSLEVLKKLQENAPVITDKKDHRNKLLAVWAKRKKDPNYREKYLKQLDRTGWKHSEQTKQLFSKQRRGVKKSKQHCENIRKFRQGTKFINGKYVKINEIF